MTANAQTMVYGDAVPTLTYNETGLVNGDTLTGRACHHRNHGLQRRRLWHHAGHARGIIELHAELHRRQPHRHGRGADCHRQCADAELYGAANPTLTYNETGLVNGDTLTGALATTATTASNVGAYGITQGTLAASSNYTLSYTGANLTVTAAALTVTANAQTRALRRRHPDAHLYRDRPGQRRHADGCACHYRNDDLERRVALRHHPGHAQ